MIAIALIILVALLFLAVPVAAALGLTALALNEIYSFMPLDRAIGEMAWRVSNSFILVAIPLYVLLGEILLRTGIATRMYSAASYWLSWLPGGLMHANIASCTMFAAMSGSSVATAATIGTVAQGEISKYRYNERLFLGSIAGGSTLGILIPPSINLIVYGSITSTSIPQLYLAGFVPGFLLAGMFMLTIVILCIIFPKWRGEPLHVNWGTRLRTLKDLVPPILVFAMVIGPIYAGWATPTESAALGVVASLILAIYYGALTWSVLFDSLQGTMRTTGMIILIIMVAHFLAFVLTSIGLTNEIIRFIHASNMSPLKTLVMIILIYLVLGCFLEPMAMMVATVPIVAPIIVAQGYDPVWFGIMLMLLLEAAMITPPVGTNLYVLQGIRRKSAPIEDVIIGSLPFFLTLLLMIVVLVAWPELATWLPTIMRK